MGTVGSQNREPYRAAYLTGATNLSLPGPFICLSVCPSVRDAVELPKPVQCDLHSGSPTLSHLPDGGGDNTRIRGGGGNLIPPFLSCLVLKNVYFKESVCIFYIACAHLPRKKTFMPWT